MATTLYYDEKFLEHETPPGHPERPERIRRAASQLRANGLDTQCRFGVAQALTRDQVARLHAAAQVAAAEKLSREGGGFLDGDTPVSSHSFETALLAAGSAVAAVDEVISGTTQNSFCLVRPPGHHATPKRCMGFCLFNNVALAAQHAIDRHGLTRVLIVDWDVHHGNGTQDIFYDNPAVMFFSAHRYPFYPGTGGADETGHAAGLGYTLNMPVAYGTSPSEYRSRFAANLEKAAARIRPDLVLLSAGFDAHRKDPIGSLDLEIEDFSALGELVLAVAKTYANGRLVSVLEGGYNLGVLADCIEQHVRQLLAAGELGTCPPSASGFDGRDDF